MLKDYANGVSVSRLHEPDQVHDLLTLPCLDRTTSVVDRLAAGIRVSLCPVVGVIGGVFVFRAPAYTVASSSTSFAAN